MLYVDNLNLYRKKEHILKLFSICSDVQRIAIGLSLFKKTIMNILWAYTAEPLIVRAMNRGFTKPSRFPRTRPRKRWSRGKTYNPPVCLSDAKVFLPFIEARRSANNFEPAHKPVIYLFPYRVSLFFHFYYHLFFLLIFLFLFLYHFFSFFLFIFQLAIGQLAFGDYFPPNGIGSIALESCYHPVCQFFIHYTLCSLCF